MSIGACVYVYVNVCVCVCVCAKLVDGLVAVLYVIVKVVPYKLAVTLLVHIAVVTRVTGVISYKRDIILNITK